MPQSRQLAAIMFTDIVGYTAMMQHDEEKAVAVIKHYNTTLEKWVIHFNGQVLNYYGDGSLCIFSSTTDAVNCSLAIQKELKTEPVVPLRIGLHIGEVFFEDAKALGDGVNVASRVQSLGQENTILISEEVYDKIKNNASITTASLGHFDFKNVGKSMEVFALTNEGLFVPHRKKMEGKLKKKKSRNRYALLFLSILILAATSFLIYKNFIAADKKEKVTDKSIAVLPFDNISNDPEQDYFANGMMDEILNHLFKIGSWRIISRTSAMAYKGTKKTAKEIANELGVANLLEGSVQIQGQQIRISVQLIDAKKDEQIWVQSFYRELKDVFAIQSEIAQEVARNLEVEIDPQIKSRIEHIPTQNVEAYTLYLQAIDDFSTTKFEQRRTLLEAAIALDSSFAEAFAELGKYWSWSGGYTGELKPEEAYNKAYPLLIKALNLNPNLVSAHVHLGNLYLWFKWDFARAESKYRKALQLNPSNTEIMQFFSDFLLAVDRPKEALDISLSASAKDKNSFDYKVLVAFGYYFNNDTTKALQTMRETFSQYGKEQYVWINYIKLLSFTGNYKVVVKEYEKHKNDYWIGEPPIILGYTAVAYEKTGRHSMAESILKDLKKKSEQSPAGSPSYFIAAFYAATGKIDLALQGLEKAYRDHEVEMYWLKVEPLFNSLHNNPKFQNIVNKIDYP